MPESILKNRKLLKVSFFAIIIITIFLIFLPAKRAILSLLLLMDTKTIALKERNTLLSRLTVRPSIKNISFVRGDKRINADIYFPVDDKRHPAILLVHGVREEGKDDYRITRFAESLARVGFIVMVPDIEGVKPRTVGFSSIKDIIASFEYLLSEVKNIDKEKGGIFAFSFGAGPALIASADSKIKDYVKFIFLLGGYYDLKNVIKYVTTGYYDFENERGFLPPQKYGKWLFIWYIADLIRDDSDRAILREIWERKWKNPDNDVEDLSAKLGREGRSVFNLIANKDPAKVYELVGQLDSRLMERIERLSPHTHINSIKADFFILHGVPDDMIPHTESLRIAKSIGDSRRVKLALLKSFSHVTPTIPSMTPSNIIKIYIPESVELFLIAYKLLSFT